MPSASISDQRAALNAGLRAHFPDNDPSLCFAHPDLAALYEIWHKLRGARAMPSRADFTARVLKPYLRHVTIVDVIGAHAGARRFRHRFVGTAIVALVGEQTGRYVDEIVPPDEMARWAAALDAIIDGRSPARYQSRFPLRPFSHLTAEWLVAPLSDDGERANMVMTVTYVMTEDA
jgi:hypothetical protein